MSLTCGLRGNTFQVQCVQCSRIVFRMAPFCWLCLPVWWLLHVHPQRPPRASPQPTVSAITTKNKIMTGNYSFKLIKKAEILRLQLDRPDTKGILQSDSHSRGTKPWEQVLQGCRSRCKTDRVAGRPSNWKPIVFAIGSVARVHVILSWPILQQITILSAL